MRTILFRTSVVGMLAASAFYAQTASAPPRYTVTDLGLVGGPPAQPFVIKNNGLISEAVAVSDNVWHAMLWFRGRQIDLAKTSGLGGPSSGAFGVNEWGQAVGEAETSATDANGEDFCGFGDQRVCLPFIWQNGLMKALPLLKDAHGLAGANGAANAINVLGQVAGVAENTTADSTCPTYDPISLQYQKFQFKPVLWDNGKIRELPTVGGDPDGIVFNINDRGQAVGGSGTCAAFQINGSLTYLYGVHAALWQNGAVTDLGNLGGAGLGQQNLALNLNNWGQVVGGSGTPDGLFHGFLWNRATGIQDLGTVGNDIASVALAINDRGDISGISFDANFNPRAYLRPAGGKMVDLNSLIPADSPLFLFDACSINLLGEIIGIAVDGAGEFHGYLATPRTGFGDGWGVLDAAPSPLRFDHARQVLRQRLHLDTLGVRPNAAH